MSENVIETSGLTMDFKSVRAIDSLSIAVPPGIVFGFLGPNGAGKTTTLRLLLGLLEPTGGSAHVLGHDIRNEPDAIRELSGALLEHNGLYERLNAWDNLDFYGRIWHMDKRQRHERIEELLTHFGLWDRRHESLSGWSRGMRQKCAVARVLLHRPRLVFLDEPTAGLDPVASASLRTDIANLARQDGTTVFLTTHNLVEAEKLCALVGVIRSGRLIALGHPDELRKNASRTSVEITGSGFSDDIVKKIECRPEVTGIARVDNGIVIGLDGDSPAAPLVSLIVDSGALVEEVHRKTPSLEDAFLKLMEEESA